VEIDAIAVAIQVDKGIATVQVTLVGARVVQVGEELGERNKQRPFVRGSFQRGSCRESSRDGLE
jgi:hypothetical protein